EPTNTQRLGVGVRRHVMGSPSRLPLGHRTVVFGPRLGRGPVVGAVLADELLQVGRRVQTQPGFEAIAAHDATLRTKRAMVLRSDSSAAFRISNCRAGKWRSIAACTIDRSRLGSMASSSTERSLPKRFARVSLFLVGRVGKFQLVICLRVTARRSENDLSIR